MEILILRLCMDLYTWVRGTSKISSAYFFLVIPKRQTVLNNFGSVDREISSVTVNIEYYWNY